MRALLKRRTWSGLFKRGSPCVMRCTRWQQQHQQQHPQRHHHQLQHQQQLQPARVYLQLGPAGLQRWHRHTDRNHCSSLRHPLHLCTRWACRLPPTPPRTKK
jgi:hypothetical protein